jgi:DNA-binding FadR family transcriptional regulator
MLEPVAAGRAARRATATQIAAMWAGEHEAVLTAIVDRDAAAAEAAMRAHR